MEAPEAWGPRCAKLLVHPHFAAAAMLLDREVPGQVLGWSRLVQEGRRPSPAVHCDLSLRNLRKHMLFKSPAVL